MLCDCNGPSSRRFLPFPVPTETTETHYHKAEAKENITEEGSWAPVCGLGSPGQEAINWSLDAATDQEVAVHLNGSDRAVVSAHLMDCCGGLRCIIQQLGNSSPAKHHLI